MTTSKDINEDIDESKYYFFIFFKKTNNNCSITNKKVQKRNEIERF